MAYYQTDELIRRKRLLVEQAVSLAMKNRWEEAVRVNRAILELSDNDVDTYNRLGRALMELGRYGEAREAYRRAVQIDPYNIIAQKNLARLSSLAEGEGKARGEKIDPRMFLAEAGKTAVVNLVRLAEQEALAKMTVGEQVYLHIEGRALRVKSASGEYLGQVEPRPSQRLIDLMKGGNRYVAAILSLEEGQVRIIIREVYQHPSQMGKVSFPTRVPEVVGIRPYTKDSLLHYGLEEEEETDFMVEMEVEQEPAEEPEVTEEEPNRL